MSGFSRTERALQRLKQQQYKARRRARPHQPDAPDLPGQRPETRAGFHTAGRVILLDDCFNTYNEPDVAKAAVQVLEAAGCEVQLAGLVCCGRPMISKGFLSQARQLIQQQAPALAARVADGTPILGLEPSCLLTLKDDYPALLRGELRPLRSAEKMVTVHALIFGSTFDIEC